MNKAAIVQILRSRVRTYSPAEDIAPSVTNADEVADLILALGAAQAGKAPDLRPPSPDFRVVSVGVLQSAYDRIDAMLANIEPDLRAANSVRIELRHLINETYSLPSAEPGGPDA